jgi:hypothetical protein
MKKTPNKACIGWRGFCGIFWHFSGFEFFPASNLVHARSAAVTATRHQLPLADD